jgi:uncharacterized protein DUF6522
MSSSRVLKNAGFEGQSHSLSMPMQLERTIEGFVIDASILGDLLNLPSSCVQDLMRQKEITSLCERGEEEHKGRYRLTFFYKGRQAQLNVDEAGEIVQRSIIDIGNRNLPATMRKG